LVLAVTACGVPEGTPRIVDSNPHGWIVAVEPDDTFTDGYELLQLDGAGTVVITKVSIDGDDGLTLVDALIAAPDGRRFAAVQYDPHFPPTGPDFGDPDDLVPAVGSEMAAPQLPTSSGDELFGYELILGLKAEGKGAYKRKAVVIDYKANGHRKSVRIPAELVVCSGMRAGEAGCEGT